ncbi:uncharacterized protein LOC111696299 [Eurytemora carolleeae]|uniref:uncharacterized protein LOC111696299 n=1 Tax=Eurytemora carolleeae TaxID=1294199 RepID=UPI000C77CDB3|nr:uncharacterized protein LOC111696299 [Eurytemora carolleeae]|eukprot:XP_023321636.1 uncharacterized protein LOC111696299 [Eurytemora affinis]
MWKVFLLLVAVAAVASASGPKGGAREPKLFFVSSSTSTSISTTTSLLSTQFTCFAVSSTALVLCTGRKKRAASLVEDQALSLDLEEPIKVSRVQRDLDTDHVHSSIEDNVSSNRQAKFAWYYMTTTITSTSTSTSTSTTFTGTLSISLLTCTPSSFVACGKK